MPCGRWPTRSRAATPPPSATTTWPSPCSPTSPWRSTTAPGPTSAGARPATGLPDVEKSLQLSPTSPHSLDTRAHIRQALGDPEGALRDYDKAMWFGGPRMIKLYQCGLTEARLYTGEIDGIWRRELQRRWRSACATRPATRCPPTSTAAPPPAEREQSPSLLFRGVPPPIGRPSPLPGSSGLAHFIHEAVWSELMGGDEAVGLA